jgi:hypothetical protein
VTKDIKVTMIVPTTEKDYLRRAWDYGLYFKLLPVKNIVFIGPETLSAPVMNDVEKQNENRVAFLNENEVIPFDSIKQCFKKRLEAEGYGISETSRLGWFYQQFLKMQYSRICEDEYYMCWDADTLPLRDVTIFDDSGKPYFDLKAEYCEGYFITIKSLLGMDKAIKDSFISEHMVFSTTLMREMLEEIEGLGFPGKSFFEKIIFAIPIDNMKRGFSEFELFGTWVRHRYPKAYSLRKWKSLRRGNIFIKMEELNADDIRWLGGSFDAISFENYHQQIPELQELFRDPSYRKNVTAEEFYDIILKSGIFGEYKDGMVIKDGEYWPI